MKTQNILKKPNLDDHIFLRKLLKKKKKGEIVRKNNF